LEGVGEIDKGVIKVCPQEPGAIIIGLVPGQSQEKPAGGQEGLRFEKDGLFLIGDSIIPVFKMFKAALGDERGLSFKL
jgi:hypothetical protein